MATKKNYYKNELINRFANWLDRLKPRPVDIKGIYHKDKPTKTGQKIPSALRFMTALPEFIAEEYVNIPARTLTGARDIGYGFAEGLTPSQRARLILPGLARLVDVGLDVAGPGMVAKIGRKALKESTETGFKKALKEGIEKLRKQPIKKTVKEAITSTGAKYGAAQGGLYQFDVSALDPRMTPSDIAKNTLMGSAMGLGVGAVAQPALRYGTLAARDVAKKTAKEIKAYKALPKHIKDEGAFDIGEILKKRQTPIGSTLEPKKPEIAPSTIPRLTKPEIRKLLGKENISEFKEQQVEKIYNWIADQIDETKFDPSIKKAIARRVIDTPDPILKKLEKTTVNALNPYDSTGKPSNIGWWFQETGKHLKFKGMGKMLEKEADATLLKHVDEMVGSSKKTQPGPIAKADEAITESLLKNVDDILSPQKTKVVKGMAKVLETVQQQAQKEAKKTKKIIQNEYENTYSLFKEKRFAKVIQHMTKEELDEFIAYHTKIIADKYSPLLSRDGKKDVGDIIQFINKGVAKTKEGAKLGKMYNELMASLKEISPGLAESKKNKAKYIANTNMTRLTSEVLDEFPQSKLTDPILSFDFLKGKTKNIKSAKDLDVPFEDAIMYRIKSGIAEATQDVRVVDKLKLLGSGDDIIEKIQKEVRKEKGLQAQDIKKFDKKIWTKEKIEAVSGFFDDPKNVLSELGIWDTFRPYFLGEAKRFETIKRFGDAIEMGAGIEDMLPHWLRMLDIKPGTKLAKTFEDSVLRTVQKYKYDPIIYKNALIGINNNVANKAYRDTPLQIIEQWVGKHDVTNYRTKKYLNDLLHKISWKSEKELFTPVEEFVNSVRRVKSVSDLGANLLTMLLQTYETKRIAAHYGIKNMVQVINRIRRLERPTYAWMAEDSSLKKYYIGKKEINPKAIAKVWGKVEDTGYYGLKNAEKLKDYMFLHAAEINGKKLGYDGKQLENYVFDEFRRFAHKYGKADLPTNFDNIWVKTALQYMTYPFKDFNLNARIVKDLALTKGKRVDSAKYMAMWTMTSALEAMFVHKVLGIGKNYLDTLKYTMTQGVPLPEAPATIGSMSSMYESLKDMSGEEGAVKKAAERTFKRELATWIPYGRQLIRKTGLPALVPILNNYFDEGGLQDIMRGYNTTASGRVRWLAPDDPIDIIRAITFGPYATEEAHDYFNHKLTAMGEKQTETFKNYLDKAPELARKYFNSRKADQLDKRGIANKKGNSFSYYGQESFITPNNNVYSLEKVLEAYAEEDARYFQIKSILLGKGDNAFLKGDSEAKQEAFMALGIEASEVEKAQLRMISGLKSERKAPIVYSMLFEEKIPVDKLVDAKLLTKNVTKEMVSQKLITLEAKEQIDNAIDMTDEYYIQKELKKRKEKVAELEKKYKLDLLKLLTKHKKDNLKLMYEFTKKAQEQKLPKYNSLTMPKYKETRMQAPTSMEQLLRSMSQSTMNVSMPRPPERKITMY